MQMTLIMSICWLGAAGISWILAQPLARLVTKGYDTPVNFGGLTRQDLYCYAFVFVGLGFFVRGFAAVLTMLGGLFASVTVSALSPGDHALLASMTVQIPRAFVETILGLISMLFANRWAKKLIDSEK